MLNIITILLAFTAVTVYSQNSCGGNCPSGSCEACPCGNSSNPIGSGATQNYLNQYGLDVNVFTCIASGESSFNANAMNQNGANMVVGLYQEGDNNGYSGEALCDPGTATQAAVSLYGQCGICPWFDDSSCFNTACCANSQANYCNNQCTISDEDREIARMTLLKRGIILEKIVKLN